LPITSIFTEGGGVAPKDALAPAQIPIASASNTARVVTALHPMWPTYSPSLDGTETASLQIGGSVAGFVRFGTALDGRRYHCFGERPNEMAPRAKPSSAA
jgi:hypothetical protein